MLISPDLVRDSLFRHVPAFQRVWPSGGWSWDNRFRCIASTISQGTSAEGWKAATELFPTVWDARNVVTAPASVTKVAAAVGGVRSGQFLLTADPVDGLLMYGLWWPWGEEGSNISMRIGLTGNPTNDERLGLRKLFKVRDD